MSLNRTLTLKKKIPITAILSNKYQADLFNTIIFSYKESKIVHPHEFSVNFMSPFKSYLISNQVDPKIVIYADGFQPITFECL